MNKAASHCEYRSIDISKHVLTLALPRSHNPPTESYKRQTISQTVLSSPKVAMELTNYARLELLASSDEDCPDNDYHASGTLPLTTPTANALPVSSSLPCVREYSSA